MSDDSCPCAGKRVIACKPSNPAATPAPKPCPKVVTDRIETCNSGDSLRLLSHGDGGNIELVTTGGDIVLTPPLIRSVRVTGGQPSTSPTTGSLVVIGGLGLTGNLNMNGLFTNPFQPWGKWVATSANPPMLVPASTTSQAITVFDGIAPVSSQPAISAGFSSYINITTGGVINVGVPGRYRVTLGNLAWHSADSGGAPTADPRTLTSPDYPQSYMTFEISSDLEPLATILSQRVAVQPGPAFPPAPLATETFTETVKASSQIRLTCTTPAVAVQGSDRWQFGVESNPAWPAPWLTVEFVS